MESNLNIANQFDLKEKIVLFNGDCIDLMRQIPDKSIQLVVTSPPYNIGKEYEKKSNLDKYIELQARVIKECERVLTDEGSICWQVGNFINNSSIIPLDIVLYPIFSDLN